jgi:1,4-alpha-glucan branching enzyme
VNVKPTFALLAALISTVAQAQTVTHLNGEGPWEVSGKFSGSRIYSVDIAGQHGEFRIGVTKFEGPFTLYTRQGAIPTTTLYDTRNIFPERGLEQAATLSNTTTPKLINGRLYFSFVSGPKGGYFLARINRNVVKSHAPGMGAITSPEGTSFRTFSPFANSIHIAGEFNGWNSLAAPTIAEGNGYRSLFIRGATPGQQYRHVIRNGTQTLWKQDPYGNQVVNSVGNSIIYNQSAFNWQSNFQMPSWNKLVIYQMHIGTFNDSPGGAPGTFATAIQRLDDLQDLGITAIKLMPVAEFPGDYSWGYNPSQPFAVETAYGGPNGLKQFVDAAHQRGIAVFLDVVHNHWGPSDLDLWRYDGWSQNNRGGLFFYQDDRANTPWGDTRPDYGRGFVRQYIRDNAMMWLNDYRIDGFRWDSVLNMRTTNQGDNPDGWSLVQWINNEINATQPWKFNIAEDLQNNPWITKTTSEGGAGFDSQWSPNFVHPMRPLLTTPSDANRNMNDLITALTDNYNGNWLQRTIYTESHDEVANGRSRVPQEIDPGNPGSYWARKRSTLGAAITMTAPGVPMIFQGQEILEDGWFQDTDPVDWNKAITYAGVRQLYKDLIALRTNKNGTTRGLTGPHLNLFHVNHGAKVVAYHRWDLGGPNDDVIVIANLSNTTFTNYTIGLPRAGFWHPVFNSDWNGYGSDYLNTFTAGSNADPNPLHGLSHRGTFALGPYSAVILKLNP